MADFLTDEWFASVNEGLARAEPVPLAPAQTRRVVFELADAPASGPHALTFSLASDSASVTPGDHLAADAIIRLAYRDAEALARGELDSANALREGRIKVRGDVNAVVPLLEWLTRAHPGAR